MEKRKGFLTPEQEKTTDDLIVLKGVAEMADGPAIAMADNKGLEAIKKKIVAKWGEEVLEDIYEIVDLIFVPLTAIANNSVK